MAANLTASRIALSHIGHEHYPLRRQDQIDDASANGAARHALKRRPASGPAPAP